MKTSELIKRLQKLVKDHGDLEVRTGGYSGTTETIDSSYHDEDNNFNVIY